MKLLCLRAVFRFLAWQWTCIYNMDAYNLSTLCSDHHVFKLVISTTLICRKHTCRLVWTLDEVNHIDKVNHIQFIPTIHIFKQTGINFKLDFIDGSTCSKMTRVYYISGIRSDTQCNTQSNWESLIQSLCSPHCLNRIVTLSMVLGWPSWEAR
jgi:hypothetical protein